MTYVYYKTANRSETGSPEDPNGHLVANLVREPFLILYTKIARPFKYFNLEPLHDVMWSK